MSSELKSVLGRKDAFALAFGAIIGWGWVILSGPMIVDAGSIGSVVAFAFAGVMVSLVGLAYAELTSAMPRAGGALAFTYRGLGPGWSWVCGWALTLGYAGVCAFEAVAIATVAHYLIPSFQLGYLYSVAGSEVYASWIAVGVLCAVLICWVNWVGIRTSGFLQWLMTVGLLAVGVVFFLGSNVFGKFENLPPHFTDLRGLLRVVMLTPFLMTGFDVIPQAAEEIKVPPRDVGKLILLSIGMALAWYMLVQWGVGLGLPSAERTTSTLATADAAVRVLQFRWAALVIVFGGVLGILSSWNAFLVGATRLLFGMARAKMLPDAFATLHEQFRTPTFGILFITALSLVAPFLGRKALVWVANASSLGIVIAYFLVAIAFLRLRFLEPNMPRPYQLRHGKMVGGLTVLVTLGFVLLYLPFSPSALIWPYEWLIVLVWGLLGAIAYRIGKRIYPKIDRAEQQRIVLGELDSEAGG